MKNRLLIASLLFAAAGVVSAEDLSVKQTALDASTPWSWNNISNWDGGTTLDGSNLTVKGTLSADNTGTIDSALTAGTLTFDIDSSTFQSKTVLNADATFDSIVFNNGNVYLDTQNAHTLLVNGSIIVNSLQDVTINNADKQLKSKNITVTNDRNKGAFSIVGGSTTGVLRMRAAEGAEGAKVVLNTFYQQLGGIDDGGVEANHYLAINGTGGTSFYVYGSYDWSGEMKAGCFGLNMSGGEGSYQRLNLTSFSADTWTTGEYKGLKGLKVSVANITFILNETSERHCLLDLKSGAFGSEKRIAFKDGKFSGGSLKILTKDTGFDFEKATKADDLKIGLDFSAITEAEEYYILSIGDFENSSGFDFTNADRDFEIKGLDESLKGSLAWNGGTLIATITAAVPEPATVAAILGVIALGFAAYRRRK